MSTSYHTQWCACPRCRDPRFRLTRWHLAIAAIVLASIAGGVAALIQLTV